MIEINIFNKKPHIINCIHTGKAFSQSAERRHKQYADLLLSFTNCTGKTVFTRNDRAAGAFPSIGPMLIRVAFCQ